MFRPLSGSEAKTELRRIYDDHDQEVSYDLDDLFALFWSKGIKFGIQTDDIKKWFSSDRKSEFVAVAKHRLPTKGTDGRIVPATDIKSKKEPTVGKDGKVDYKRLKCSFPQAKERQYVLKIIPAVPGKP